MVRLERDGDHPVVKCPPRVIHGFNRQSVPVDLDSFNKVQTLLQQNGKSGGRTACNKHEALLRGLMHCGACDCGMSHSYSQKGSKLYRYYVCHWTQKRVWGECPAPSVPAGEIERFVVDQIKRIGHDPALIRDTLAQVRRQTEEGIQRLTAEKTALARDVRHDYADVGKLAGITVAGDPRIVEVQTRTPRGRLPRVTKLMALAIRLDQLIRDGHVTDQAELARLSHVSRARLTQIMNLLQLAPDIQEAVLNLPRTESGRDAVTERDLRPIAGMVSWSKQRREWAEIGKLS